jgi:hypothetical protein
VQNPASYRDNSGFIFTHQGTHYRYIAPIYLQHYNALMQGGLYNILTQKQYLITHTEMPQSQTFGFNNGKVILPEQLTFLNYPYEWCFSMWQDAALLTLNIAIEALQKNMVLKDATPFNVQFFKGKPIFIDTLSFEVYVENQSWVAYQQFVQCFLGPLLLMHYNHPSAANLFALYPNGIPLQVLKTLLPFNAKFNLHTYLHVYLPATVGAQNNKKQTQVQQFSKQKFVLLLNGLKSYVQKLQVKKVKTTWSDYYSNTILNTQYLNDKTEIVKNFLPKINFTNVIDLGANDGHFSLLFNATKNVVACDADVNCINELYKKIKATGISNILPLVNDIAAPAAAIGFANTERQSFSQRFKADLVLALALIHHLAIANNLPLPLIAQWLANSTTHLVIEFVPKADDKVVILLQNRNDIFDDYNLTNFKNVFCEKFEIIEEILVPNTQRALFLMKTK